MIEHISSQNFNETVNSGGRVLVDFFAAWCNPCKMLAPVLGDISEKLPRGKRIVGIDIDLYPDVAARFGVMSIPTLVTFENGKMLQKLVGVQDRDTIENMLGL